MSHLIGTKIEPFCVQAYQAGKTLEVTEKDLEGQWSISVV